MAAAELISLLVATTFAFVVGMALNIHILLVYMGNLRRGLPLVPSEKVHILKALVNVSLHLVLATQCLVYAFWPHLFFTGDIFLWIMMIDLFLIGYSYWLMALLCVYYVINITSTGHQTMVWLKRSLTSHLHHILLMCGLGSVGISSPVFWFCDVFHVGNVTFHPSDVPGMFHQNTTYRITAAVLGCFLPFTIALVSTVFTSWSLINHMWTMKQNNMGFTLPKFQVQVNAVRTMFLFLLIALIYNVTQMFLLTSPMSSSIASVLWSWLVLTSFPISESIIIIQSSGKLKKTLLKMFFNRKRVVTETET